jgi:hypothetical protein
MPKPALSLATLYATYDAFAYGTIAGDSRPAYAAILLHLGENQRLAEAGGWKDCTLERLGGGHLHLTGIAQGQVGRETIPDLQRGEQA